MGHKPKVAIRVFCNIYYLIKNNILQPCIVGKTIAIEPAEAIRRSYPYESLPVFADRVYGPVRQTILYIPALEVDHILLRMEHGAAQ